MLVYTDGACSGNPGPGGWAYVLAIETFQGLKVLEENSGAEKGTTNNRMELMAVISALEALKNMDQGRKAQIFTDSQYVQRGMTEWIQGWKKKGWKASDKTPVKNQDLWQRLDALASDFSLTWTWIKGHAGNTYNERCDALAQKAINSIIRDQGQFQN
jgi:ribonuclease HI